MTALDFTRRVLGEAASEALEFGKVVQTIRSRKSAVPLFKFQGKDVPVNLDGQFLYNAHIVSIKGPVALSELNEIDATYGGFESLDELKHALKIAGFRFKPFSEYSAYRINFQRVANW